MASTEFLQRLHGVLQSLDDEALASLANKGLLRRAAKDLSGGAPEIAETTDDRVRLTFPDANVEILELPAQSACDCPASGVCRHLLAGFLFLRNHSSDLFATSSSAVSPTADTSPHSAAPPAATSAEVLGKLTDKDLQKWAGKPTWRKGMQMLEGDPQVEFDVGAALIVRFPQRNVACRWLPSPGLAGLVCSCKAVGACEHQVAAVIAYQASLGNRKLEFTESALAESSGAPRTREEVLVSVSTVLREMISLGLARVSVATSQRLTTLAVSAHGVDLPRLERMLKSLAEEVELLLGRNAQSSAVNILSQAARIEALRAALAKNATAALVGRHRSKYYEVGQIKLVGMGAQQWRSNGGYCGVTVYFWDLSRKGWSTWTDARPRDQVEVSYPSGRFRAEGPWPGCDSPRQASTASVQLTGAWRNPEGRLSARSSVRAMVTGDSRPGDAVEAIRDWAKVAEHARRIFAGGLSESTENRDLVVLAPTQWLPAQFDPLTQEMTRSIVDESGRLLDLWLPFTLSNEQGLDVLEHPEAGEARALLGAVRLVNGQVRVQPISLYLEDQTVHVNLPGDAFGLRRRKKRRVAASANSDSHDTDSADVSLTPTATSPLGQLLITAQAETESIAESGVAARRDRSLLRRALRRFEALGLTTVARPLATLLDSLANAGKLADPAERSHAAGTLLKSYYIMHLAATQEALSAACAALD